jgi:hypothetical protein
MSSAAPPPPFFHSGCLWRETLSLCCCCSSVFIAIPSEWDLWPWRRNIGSQRVRSRSIHIWIDILIQSSKLKTGIEDGRNYGDLNIFTSAYYIRFFLSIDRYDMLLLYLKCYIPAVVEGGRWVGGAGCFLPICWKNKRIKWAAAR